MYKQFLDPEFLSEEVSGLISRWAGAFQSREVDHPVLYHYTSADGLLGILQSGKLWATASDFSNDLTEVDFAKGRAENYLRTVEIAEPLRTIGLSIAEYLSGAGEPLQRAYVFSFCAEDDLLSQWRGYGHAGGFAIGFSRLLSRVPGGFATPAFHIAGKSLLKPVIYSDAEQERSFRCIFERGAEVRDAIVAEGATPKAIDNFLRFLLLVEVVAWIHAVKHPKFAEEKEWRLVAFPLPPRMARGLNSPMDPKFRILRGIPTPYLELRPETPRFDVTRIVCGPAPDLPMRVKAVRRLLGELKYPDAVLVEKSDVPLRT